MVKPDCTRRTLLRTAALGAASSALPSCLRVHAQAPAPSTIQLGVASYTFRNFTRAQLIGYLQKLNVSALNAKDVKDHLPAELAAEAAALAAYTAAGIQLHAGGTVPCSSSDATELRASFDYARRAGLRVLVIGDPTPQNLPILDKLVKEYDIRLAIHNHGPEDKLWHSPLDVLKAVGTLDPRIGCCIDVGHCARAGVDPVAAVHQVGPRLFNMHVKDLTDFTSKESQVAVGDGRMPVREIFQALAAIRYTGYVDLEYEIHPDDPLPGVTRSFANMRQVLATLPASSA